MTRSVICYCYHVSHVFNLGRIPSLLAASGWQVRWLNAFPATDFPLPTEGDIEYGFNIPLTAVGNETADLYLSPFVGQSEHFPHGAKRVHFLVSLTSLEGVYDKSMFDYYDAIACAGPHHMEEFTALGRQRHWSGKLLLPVGYPKLDDQHRRLVTLPLTPTEAPLTVVFAPTHAYYVNSKFSVLGTFGEQIIDTLLKDDIKVIFRPHMESWRDQDRPVVEHIVDRYRTHPLFVIDRSSNYFETYAQSHLMLTDISGTGFTYAFTFGRPALFFAPDAASELGKTGIQFENRENIGLVVRSLEELLPRLHLIRKHMNFLTAQIASFRDWLIFNPGRSEQYFADNATLLIQEKTAAGWRHI